MRSPRIPLQVILAISDFQNPHFQNKRNCKTFLVKMRFICIRMKKKTWMASHLASLWNKGSDGATWKWLAWHFTQVGIIARGRGGGGYSWEFLVGLCRLVHQILTLFQTKTCHFPNPFSDLVQWPLKSMPVFRPKGPKTIPFGAAHNYIAYIREYPPRKNRNF